MRSNNVNQIPRWKKVKITACPVSPIPTNMIQSIRNNLSYSLIERRVQIERSTRRSCTDRSTKITSIQIIVLDATTCCDLNRLEHIEYKRVRRVIGSQSGDVARRVLADSNLSNKWEREPLLGENERQEAWRVRELQWMQERVRAAKHPMFLYPDCLFAPSKRSKFRSQCSSNFTKITAAHPEYQECGARHNCCQTPRSF
jgi:hypothetical protein